MRLARSLCPDQYLQPHGEADRYGMAFQCRSQASSLHTVTQHAATKTWHKKKFLSVQMPGRASYWQAACVSVGLVSSEADCSSHRGGADFMTDPNELQGLPTLAHLKQVEGQVRDFCGTSNGRNHAPPPTKSWNTPS